MEYDLVVQTFDLGTGCFGLSIFEARTNRLIYQSPALDAGDCASAMHHFYAMGQAQGYKVQVCVCEGLAAAARQIVSKLN